MKRFLGFAGILVLVAWASATWADVTVYSPSVGVAGNYATIQAEMDDCQVV